MKKRIHIILENKDTRMLDELAEHYRYRLEPQHAANAGHKFNRKETILRLIRDKWMEVFGG